MENKNNNKNDYENEYQYEFENENGDRNNFNLLNYSNEDIIMKENNNNDNINNNNINTYNNSDINTHKNDTIKNIYSDFFTLNSSQMNKIFRDIGYEFNNPNLLINALTRKSAFSNKYEKVSKSYERLEYLGDSIIKFLTSEYLFNQFPMNNEGELTFKRNKLESNQFLSIVSNSLNLCGYLNADVSESNKITNYKLQADLFEALIGAIYIDSDKDIKIVSNLMEKFIFINYLEESDFENTNNSIDIKNSMKNNHYDNNINDINVNKLNNDFLRRKNQKNILNCSRNKSYKDKFKNQNQNKIKNLEKNKDKEKERDKYKNKINELKSHSERKIGREKEKEKERQNQIQIEKEKERYFSYLRNNSIDKDNYKDKDKGIFHDDYFHNVNSNFNKNNNNNNITNKNYNDNNNNIFERKKYYTNNNNFQKANLKISKNENEKSLSYQSKNPIEFILKNFMLKLENKNFNINLNERENIKELLQINEIFKKNLSQIKHYDENYLNKIINIYKYKKSEEFFEKFSSNEKEKEKDMDLLDEVNEQLNNLLRKNDSISFKNEIQTNFLIVDIIYNDLNSLIIDCDKNKCATMKISYGKFLMKEKNYEMAEIIFKEVLRFLFKEKKFEELNFSIFTKENLLIIVEMEYFLSKIYLKLEVENKFIEHYSNLINLIEYLEESKINENKNCYSDMSINNNWNSNDNFNHNNKIFAFSLFKIDFYMIKRKSKKMVLMDNLKKYENNIPINFNMMKDILNIDMDYLKFGNYFFKDLLLFQMLIEKMFAKNNK
jgi:dsRNA-specific ribonuclease